jgi:hypothetical protein
MLYQSSGDFTAGPWDLSLKTSRDSHEGRNGTGAGILPRLFMIFAIIIIEIPPLLICLSLLMHKTAVTFVLKLASSYLTQDLVGHRMRMRPCFMMSVAVIMKSSKLFHALRVHVDCLRTCWKLYVIN